MGDYKGLGIMKILILGANGMLGSELYRFFSTNPNYKTYGTVRSTAKKKLFLPMLRSHLICDVSVEHKDNLESVILDIRPDIVINCIGIIKQLDEAKNHLASIEINAALPHRLAQFCQAAGARLIHVSTDCVFSGNKGYYTETDFADADDLYGRSKFLGEVDYPHTITIRTSIIGHELDSAHSLVNWFLSQKGTIYGYQKAIFSGLPTIEIARVIHDYIIPYPELFGLYHLSAAPISKFDLLKLIASVYRKQIIIMPNDELIINRSLNSDRFKNATGYCPPSWDKLINAMYDAHKHIPNNMMDNTYVRK